MVHFEGEHFTGLACWLTVPNSTITLWTCPKSQIDGQNHKNTGIRRKIFHKRPSRRADLGTLRMDDHWPVRNVFYERLRCWHLAWDSKLLSWQFDNTSTFWNKKKSYRLFLWLIPSKKYEKKFQCRNRHPPKSSNSFPWWRIWSLNDSAIFGIHDTSQKKDRKFFCLPLPPIFNLRWFECLEIPTIVNKRRILFLLFAVSANFYLRWFECLEFQQQ